MGEWCTQLIFSHSNDGIVKDGAYDAVFSGAIDGTQSVRCCIDTMDQFVNRSLEGVLVVETHGDAQTRIFANPNEVVGIPMKYTAVRELVDQRQN